MPKCPKFINLLQFAQRSNKKPIGNSSKSDNKRFLMAQTELALFHISQDQTACFGALSEKKAGTTPRILSANCEHLQFICYCYLLCQRSVDSGEQRRVPEWKSDFTWVATKISWIKESFDLTRNSEERKYSIFD